LELARTAMGDRIRLAMVRARGRLDSLVSQLGHLSPLGVLERGYAIVQDERGRILKDAGDAPLKSLLDVRLARGRLRARVTRSVTALEE